MYIDTIRLVSGFEVVGNFSFDVKIWDKATLDERTNLLIYGETHTSRNLFTYKENSRG